MTDFESYRSYWAFAKSVTSEWRYARTAPRAAFLKAVLETSAARQEGLAAGARLWRAQLGHSWQPEDLGDGTVEEAPAPFNPDRMKPLSDRAREGRANPKGIPYLYLATHQETAIAEVRPWVGSHVSVAQFVLTRNVRVVNCTTDDNRIMIYGAEPEPRERERAVWRDIDRAFSQPVTSVDDVADYSPTQVLAEFLRESGLDGVAYGSSLGEGHNVALFDTEAATLESCGLVEIRAVKFDASRASNQYFVTGGIPEGSTHGAHYPPRAN